MPAFLSLSPTSLLLGIALLVLLIIVLMLVLLWRSKKKQEQAQAEEAQDAQENEAQAKPALLEKPAEVETRHSVSSALRFLEKNSIGRGLRYRSPWFLVLG